MMESGINHTGTAIVILASPNSVDHYMGWIWDESRPKTMNGRRNEAPQTS